MPFKFTMLKAVAAALTIASVSPAFAVGVPVKAATPSYRFELVGPAQPAGAKQHAISVRIIRSLDNKPVIGAAVTSVRLDMGPENMAAMTAPVKQLPNSAAGVYSFSFDDGAVWFERAKWALTITATVQGERQPVIGSVVFQAGR
ncbi:MAG: FixH family protein [Alphaproteobacteria bacterium]|nr:FixH family protein [Alphaproteobacteria bacterium]